MSKLNRRDKHTGVFVNSKGANIAATIQWDEKEEGFVLRNAATGKPLLPESYESLGALRAAGHAFELDKVKPEPVAA